jgi:hypothetical protein
MEPMDDSHFAQELLEEYAVRGIPANRVDVTNHLMACDSCNEIYEAELNFKERCAEAMQMGVEQRPHASVFSFSKPVWAATGALLVMIFMNSGVQPQSNAAQVLDMAAVRGAQSVHARSGVPLVLRLDTTGLDVRSAVQVAVVNDRGRAVWTGPAQHVDSVWKAQTARGLRPGRYWVRIPDPANPGELLREFQLDVQ